MSGKGLIQMTAKEKLNARQKVNFLFLNPASELTQDWSSEPLANEVGEKATSFLGILELFKGWWSYRLTKMRIIFCPCIPQHNYDRKIADPDDCCRQETQHDMSGELSNGKPIHSKCICRTGVRCMSQTVKQIRHMSLEQKIVGANKEWRNF